MCAIMIISLLSRSTEYYHDCEMSRTSYTSNGVYTIKPDHLPAFDVCINTACS